MDSLGKRLKEARRTAGLTQEALARLADCSLMTVSRYERGDRTGDSATVARLAAALSVAPGWLLYGEGGEANDAA